METQKAQYFRAIEYAASYSWTPRETIDLIARMWSTPRAVVEEDIRKARHPTPVVADAVGAIVTSSTAGAGPSRIE